MISTAKYFQMSQINFKTNKYRKSVELLNHCRLLYSCPVIQSKKVIMFRRSSVCSHFHHQVHTNIIHQRVDDIWLEPYRLNGITNVGIWCHRWCSSISHMQPYDHLELPNQHFLGNKIYTLIFWTPSQDAVLPLYEGTWGYSPLWTSIAGHFS